MILLQVYLYTQSLLRGINFIVLPYSNYALSSMILPLLETFLELLLWKSFQCHCHIFFGCFQYSEIFAHTLFGKSQKSFEA